MSQLKVDSIKHHISDRIPKEFLKNHMLSDEIKWTTLICRASGLSSLRVLQALIETGADIYNVNDSGDSALTMSWYSDKDTLPKVKYLIDHDNDLVNATDCAQYTPLHIAASRGLVDVCTFILKHGANVHARECQCLTCFHIAAMTNKTQVMDLLLTHGARIDDQTNNNNTAIHLAAHHGALDAVTYLLDKGIDSNVPGCENRSPLCAAAFAGRINVVDELIRRGADVRHQYVYGLFYFYCFVCFI